MTFYQIWEILNHYFFKYDFCTKILSPPFWDSNAINVRIFGTFHTFLRLHLYLKLYFPSSANSTISIHLSSSCLTPLTSQFCSWTNSIVFWNSDIVLFVYKIAIHYFLHFCFSVEDIIFSHLVQECLSLPHGLCW